MTFYISLFPGAKVENVVRYGPGQPGPEGTVMQASFSIAGQSIMCIDSPAPHAFTFTPSFSFFVDCESEDELRRVFAALEEGGQVMMPIDNYGFSRMFGWVADRFGVSWQLNLP
ncbi:hypothetical protein D3C72_2219200 [compost metagenome]